MKGYTLERRYAMNWLASQQRYTLEKAPNGLFHIFDNEENKQVTFSYCSEGLAAIAGWETVGDKQIVFMTDIQRTIEMSRREVEALANDNG